MGSLTINDFRAAMGKYNLGSLTLESKDGNLKLKHVNSHNLFRSIRNVTNVSEKENAEVREQFYKSIEAYFQSKGLETNGESKSGQFLAAIKDELLGVKKGAALQRSADVARILDKVDAAVELKDFDWSTGDRANLTLNDRFVFTLNKGAPKDGNFRFAADEGRASMCEQTLAVVKDMLDLDVADPAKQPNVDERMLRMAMRNADISQTRTMTYLMTRPETLLVKAEQILKRNLEKMGEEGLQEAVRVGKQDLARLALAVAIKELHVETVSAKGLSEFSGDKRLASNMIMGLDSFDAARLAKNGELNALLTGLSSLISGQQGACTVKILGQQVTLAKNEAGGLDATMGKVRFAAFGDAKVLLRNVENAIVNGKMDIEQLKTVYKNKNYLSDDSKEGQRRLKTIASALIMKMTDLGEIELQALRHSEFKDIAYKIVLGDLKDAQEVKKAVGDVTSKSSKMYSDSTLEMVTSYLNAKEDVRNRAVIAEERPKDQTPAVNKFVSDLFMNSDVWVMDNTDMGGRIGSVLKNHAETLIELLGNEGLLKTLPEIGDMNVRDTVKAILAKLSENGVSDIDTLKAFLDNKSESEGLLAKIAVDVENAAADAIAKIQEAFTKEMSKDVTNVSKDNRESWEKSLNDLISEQQKSAGSAEGRFINKLFSEYMARSTIQEKRSMVASLLRLTTEDSKTVQKFSAVLKGAGPVFQKLLQGFPEEQIPESMRGVFADMKSNLAPIPDVVVKATLAKIVEDSGNKIESITLDKTLGSATVGQAFLCTIRNSDGSSGKAVIKMLKPDVQNRFAREVGLLRKMVGELNDPGFAETFEGRLSTIKDELNFNVEAENVKSGQVYNKGGTVKSVELYNGVASDMNVLVLALAEGDTVDHVLSKVDGKLADVKNELAGGNVVTDFGTLQKTRMELLDLAEDLSKTQTYLYDLSKRWFEEAIFGKGFFHGDMHAGNIMVSDKGVTVIDYGNAMTLSDSERTNLKRLICAAGANDSELFGRALDELLKGNKSWEELSKDDGRRKEYLSYLDDVFSKGGLGDTDAKLFVALNDLQNKGIKIPAAVYNYTSSQNRLKNAIKETGDRLEAIKDMLAHTTLDVSSVYASTNDGGGMLPVYASAKKIPNLFPVIQQFETLIYFGFSGDVNKMFLSCRKNLTPENRTAVVEKLMADNGKNIPDVLLPLVAECKKFEKANEALVDKLVQAERELKAAATEDSKRKAVGKIVEALHEIQLEIIAGVERADKLPDRLTLGGAFADVIESKIRKANGDFDYGAALKNFSDVAFFNPIIARELGNRLDANVEIERARPKKETLLAENNYQNNYWSCLNKSWRDLNDVPRFKSYAQNMRFSLATLKNLKSDTVKFGENENARKAFARELAINLKKIYIQEACRGKNLLMEQRAWMISSGSYENYQGADRSLDTSGAPGKKTFRQKAELGDKLMDEPANKCIAYISIYLHHIESPGLFDNIGHEISENKDLMSVIAKDMKETFTLTDDDCKQIVDSSFDVQVKLRGKDPKLLNDKEKEALRKEIDKQVRADFKSEQNFYTYWMSNALFAVCCTHEGDES